MNPTWAFLVSFGVCVLLMPRLIPALVKLKATQVISDDGPERHHIKQGTPTMGGLGIILAFVAGIAFTAWLTSQYHEVGRWIVPVVAVVLVTLGYSALGALDDYLIIKRGKAEGLNREQKLAAQFALAIVFVIWLAKFVGPGIGIARFGFLVHSDAMWREAFLGPLNWVYYVFAVLLMVWMSNAVNITDGLDGLVAGLTPICAVALSYPVLRAFAPGIEWIPAVTWAMAGACLGFLVYNANPAKVFMGDTSALAIGPALTAVALLSGQEWVFMIFAGVFTVELASVAMQIVSYKLTKRRIFKMSPLHHHFELSGWSEPKIVTTFWVAGAALAVIGIALVGP